MCGFAGEQVERTDSADSGGPQKVGTKISVKLPNQRAAGSDAVGFRGIGCTDNKV